MRFWIWTRTLIEYTYYRLVRVIKKIFGGGAMAEGYASGYIIACIIFNLTPIIYFILYYACGISPQSYLDWLRKIVIVFAILTIIIFPGDTDEKLYNKLEEKYKNEKHQFLKGLGIISYFIFSMIVFVYFMITI